MSALSKACEFSPKARKEIHIRDGGCIFCQMGYRPSCEAGGALQIMHFVPRSQKGLGIPENGALGCVYHHQMLDNGLYHEEMKEMFREYLMSHYPEWNESSLVYDKWSFLKESQ